MPSWSVQTDEHANGEKTSSARWPPRSARVNGAPSARASENSGAGWPAAMTAMALAAQAELADQRAVALEILLLDVVEEPPAAPDEHQQAAARVVIVLVRAQVLGEAVDAARE